MAGGGRSGWASAAEDATEAPVEWEQPDGLDRLLRGVVDVELAASTVRAFLLALFLT